MTTRPAQCLVCRHLFEKWGDSGLACDAFPGGIPLAVLSTRFDHRQPIEGDHGIRFEANEGEVHPVPERLGFEPDELVTPEG